MEKSRKTQETEQRRGSQLIGVRNTKVLGDGITLKQKELAQVHGTPAEFAQACYSAVPGFISMAEAEEAVEKYNKQWAMAGDH